MPVMDGIETLVQIKKRWPNIKVIMFSTLTSRGAAATMDALMSGADDYVCKPANVQSAEEAIAMVNTDLLPRVKALHKSVGGTAPANTRPTAPPAPTGVPNAATAFRAPAPASSPTTSAPIAPTAPRTSATAPAFSPPTSVSPVPTAATPAPAARVPASGARPKIIAIAVSTGGPNALATLLPMLPRELAVPIVVVQHIPPMFSKALADRLDSKSPCKVSECVEGATLHPGEIWIAQGDHHMTVQRDGLNVRLATNQGPPENSCRPAADVLFRSVAATYGAEALAVVLTGMGSDGLEGTRAMTAQGARVIVQDEATSVVWGMPGAVDRAGLAEKTLPLEQIATEIISRCGIGAGIPANR
jgi:two-component system chemotaxis response regulator CheB